MSSHTIELKHNLRSTPVGQARVEGPPYAVCASLRVKAETRRLFQAFVTPEYLEAWLCVPNRGPSWSVTPIESPPGFVLESSDQNEKAVRVLAGFNAWRRRRLSIRWKFERNRQFNESRVTVRLIGDFECSILSLCHTGLSSPDDFGFHRQLWSESLDRLATLFRGISTLESAQQGI